MDDIRVVVADSDPLFSEALALALSDYPGIEVAGFRPKTGPQLLGYVAKEKPCVVLVDFWLRVIQGPGVAAATAAASQETGVILLPWLYGPREISYAFAAGAAGVLPKSSSLDEVWEAVRRVAGGEKQVCPDDILALARGLGRQHREAAAFWDRLRSLTYREFQILNLLGSGFSMKEIASTLSIKPATAQTHIHRVLEKTGTSGRHQAAALARSYGIAPP